MAEAFAYACVAYTLYRFANGCRLEWKRYTPGGPSLFSRPVVNQRSIHG